MYKPQGRHNFLQKGFKTKEKRHAFESRRWKSSNLLSICTSCYKFLFCTSKAAIAAANATPKVVNLTNLTRKNCFKRVSEDRTRLLWKLRLSGKLDQSLHQQPRVSKTKETLFAQLREKNEEITAFRGRGRGWGGGRGGGGFRIAKQVPFELFPEIEELGTAAGVKQDVSFALRYNRLQKYWNSSPYYIGDESVCFKKTQNREIERFSDRKSGKAKSKALLSDFIRMEPDYVPAELAKGEKKEKHGAKRVKWNPESDLQKLDVFEKLEQKQQGEDINEKKEEEEEEEDEKVEEEEEYSDDGDYNQNIDFDDDEDDFNMGGDDNDDEPIF